MIYRTEGWLAWSPVTMVRKATEADLVALGFDDANTDVADAPAVEDSMAAEEADRGRGKRASRDRTRRSWHLSSSSNRCSNR
jgi:hypothetical protein